MSGSASVLLPNSPIRRRLMGGLILLASCIWLLFYFVKRARVWPTSLALAALFLVMAGTLVWEFLDGSPDAEKKARTTSLLKAARAVLQLFAIALVVYAILGHTWPQVATLAAAIFLFAILWLNSALRKRGEFVEQTSLTAPLFGLGRCPLCWGVSLTIIAVLSIILGTLLWLGRPSWAGCRSGSQMLFKTCCGGAGAQAYPVSGGACRQRERPLLSAVTARSNRPLRAPVTAAL